MEEQTKDGASAAPAKKHAKAITAIAVVASVIVALGVFLMVWFLGDSYPDFDNRFRQETAIPALVEGFIPQGTGNYGDTQLISGYMNDGSPSRIYVIENGETTGYVTVSLGDDEIYAGHACGVATNGSKFWLVSEGTVYVLRYTDVVWDAVQRMDNHPSRGRSGKSGSVSLFAGLLRCMDCGASMRYMRDYRKKTSGKEPEYKAYVCNRYASGGKDACSSHYIN